MATPGFRLIDTHLHQWDLDQCSYDWLDADLPPVFHRLRRTFNVDEVHEHSDACGVTEAVLVQAENSLCDTDAMFAVSRADDRVVAVVGWVDLLDPDGVPAALDSLRGAGPLVGIRHLIHDEPDPD